MTQENKLPVHVLSGFLGSGKTTLLKRLLAGPDWHDVALLVNEFGEVGIDHLLLNEVAPDIVLLPGGCLCCAIRGELKQALLDLYERRQRGQLPPFSKIILETTGLADPAPILATLLHDRQLQYHFSQGMLVTLVDSEHGWQQAEQQPEWLAQVTAADWLLLSKTDRVSPAALPALRAYLQQLNPLAQIACSTELADGDLSLFETPFNPQAPQRFRRWLGKVAGPLKAQAPLSDASAEHPATTTCVITFEQQINWSAFAVWLSMLLHCHGQSILRIKGLLNVAESATPVVIHGVQHSLHPPIHLSAWPETRRQSQLVFIMRGISSACLHNAFTHFLQPYTTETDAIGASTL
ncbi:CobW family GTP-binding protein [Chania multitudinisentens]|uniref:CobW family GTP-binding protein n=1 Tax=Chania multitudinisentens TaxID=1639108 RepID=UPI0004631A6F|nr:GTP-binding protein [Chania multitudinisentens]